MALHFPRFAEHSLTHSWLLAEAAETVLPCPGLCAPRHPLPVCRPLFELQAGWLARHRGLVDLRGEVNGDGLGPTYLCMKLLSPHLGKLRPCRNHGCTWLIPPPYGACTQEPLRKGDLGCCEDSHHPSPKDVLMESESKGYQKTQSSLLGVGGPLLIRSTL